MEEVRVWLPITENNWAAIAETVNGSESFWKRQIGYHVGWEAGRAEIIVTAKPKVPFIMIDDNYFFRRIYKERDLEKEANPIPSKDIRDMSFEDFMSRMTKTLEKKDDMSFMRRMDAYLDETAKHRWSQAEMMVLYVWPGKSIEQLKKMLPKRSEEDIVEMNAYLNS
jgi:hypothetical protein